MITTGILRDYEFTSKGPVSTPLSPGRHVALSAPVISSSLSGQRTNIDKDQTSQDHQYGAWHASLIYGHADTRAHGQRSTRADLRNAGIGKSGAVFSKEGIQLPIVSNFKSHSSSESRSCHHHFSLLLPRSSCSMHRRPTT